MAGTSFNAPTIDEVAILMIVGENLETRDIVLTRGDTAWGTTTYWNHS